jgi:magnesium transporter
MLLRRGDGSLAASPSLADIPAALADPKAVLWVDFLDESDPDCRRVLSDTFGFHPLAIDDALKQSHVPKVDDWERYLYIVLHAVDYDPNSEQALRSKELDIFAGPGFVVTHREEEIEPLDRVWEGCTRDVRFMEKGSVRLLYHIIDEIVAGHMPAVDAIDDEMDGLEGVILASPGRDVLPRIQRLKRSLLHLRRVIGPQREVLNRLARDQYAVILDGERIYFRDVYDHLVRLHDLTEGLRDLASGALDTYLSVINNRMNEVMKTFTLITTLFMPISFITGFFGMNFFSPSAPPESWTGRIALGAVCTLVVLIPSLMFLWLKRRRWV